MSNIPGYNEPFPYRDVIIDRGGKATDIFIRFWEQSLQRRLDFTPVLPQPLERLENQSATATGNLGGLQSAGLYRVSYYGEIITAAGVSSSLTLTLTWTHNGKPLSRTYAAMTGNTTSTTDGQVDAIEIDANSTIGYTLTYASNPATVMVYQATLGLELIQPIS